MIYFLLDEDERRIEIGLTLEMHSRLACRRRAYGANLRLLAVMAGGEPEVMAIRYRFSPLLTCEGWHRIDNELTKFIDRHGTPWDRGESDTTPEFRDRLERLADRSHIPTAVLAAVALNEWAERHGGVDDTDSDRAGDVLLSSRFKSRNVDDERVPRPTGSVRSDRKNDGDEGASKHRTDDPAARTTGASVARLFKTWDTGDRFADDVFSDDGNSTFPPEDQSSVHCDATLPTRHPCLW